MVKVLHWCALRISDFAIWLHEKGGNLELWCDERTYRRKWTSLGMAYDVPITWVKVPDLDLSDFKMPMPIRIDDGAGDDFVKYLRALPDKEAVALCKHAVKVGPDAHHNLRQLSLSHAFTQWLLDMEHLFDEEDA